MQLENKEIVSKAKAVQLIGELIELLNSRSRELAEKERVSVAYHEKNAKLEKETVSKLTGSLEIIAERIRNLSDF